MPKSQEALQWTTGAMAGNPTGVLEPVARVLESDRQARRMISIAIYIFTGRRWFFKIPQKWREECDVLVSLVKTIIRELGIEKAVELKIRPWWIFWWLPLCMSGAWRVPILTINGRVFSQGVVPRKAELEEYLLRIIS